MQQQFDQHSAEPMIRESGPTKAPEFRDGDAEQKKRIIEQLREQDVPVLATPVAFS